jgi:hypothetical protein
VSEIVASIDVSTVTPNVLGNILCFLTKTMKTMYSMETIAVTADGAGENSKVFKSFATDWIDHFLPPDLKASFPDIAFDQKCLKADPITGDPLLFLPDMPHLIKNMVTAMEKSSKPHSKRDLRYCNNPINLNAIEAMWKATGGHTQQQNHTKLTNAHFHKDAYSRMRVYLSVQVLSQSVVNMLKQGVEDEDVEVPLGKKRYASLIAMAERVDRLVDIFNGRLKNSTGRMSFTPENGKAIQLELLEILQWFSKWHSVHNERLGLTNRITGKTFDTKFNFFADETWRNLQWLVLGNVFLIQYWVLDRGFSINPRTLNTDCMEHHFGNCRQITAGSHHGLTVSMWQAGDAKASRLKQARHALKGNNSNAPDSFGSKVKW